MKDWSCKLEVVTPMFLAGADQSCSELRPPSFKALMRWWYRAAKADLTPEEGLLFGTTDQASRFRLRLTPDRIIRSTFERANFQSKQDQDNQGLLYLGFSLDAKSQGGQRKRSSIDPGSTFCLELSLPHSQSAAERSLLASLWLLIWLGGVGSRSRRGFGSLCFTDADPLNEAGLPPKEKRLQLRFQGNFQHLPDFLQENLRVAIDWIGSAQTGNTLPAFTTLGRHNSRLFLWKKPFPTWEGALDNAGKMLMDYRRRKHDYEQIKKFLLDPSYSPTAVERAAFGLPILFYFTSVERQKLPSLIEKKFTRQGKSISRDEAERIASIRNSQQRKQKLLGKGLKREDVESLLRQARSLSTATITGGRIEGGGSGNIKSYHERRASPLLIKVIKVNDREYGLLFLLMKSQILEQGEQILIESKSRPPVLVNQPSFRTVIPAQPETQTLNVTPREAADSLTWRTNPEIFRDGSVSTNNAAII